MLDKQQLHDELTEKVKSQIFQKQLQSRLEDHLAKRISDGNKAYSEKVDRKKYMSDVDHTARQFVVPNDDAEL